MLLRVRQLGWEMGQALGGLWLVLQRLREAGVVDDTSLDAFKGLVKSRLRVNRGDNVVAAARAAPHFSWLLEGVACSFTRDRDGGRQIHAFHYPGDFLGLHHLLGSKEQIEVEALSSCAIGVVDGSVLEQAIERHAAVGRTLWRAAMVEASIARQRLKMSRRPAAEKIAHVLCEQLFRLGVDVRRIPFTQVEIADAAGVSAVHANRVFQEFRTLGLVGKVARNIEILNREGLEKLAGFDGRYLTVESRWDLRLHD